MHQSIKAVSTPLLGNNHFAHVFILIWNTSKMQKSGHEFGSNHALLGFSLSTSDYIITQVVLASWLVFAYGSLEDRCTIDVIIRKFFLLCFKMAESFENVDNILCDWAEDKVQKKSCWGNWTGSRVRKKKDKATFRKWFRKKY